MTDSSFSPRRRWSDAGCRVSSSNATSTVCECDHLTHFALMMRPLQRGEKNRPKHHSSSSSEQEREVQIASEGDGEGNFVLGHLDIFGSVLAAVIVFAVFIAVVMVSTSKCFILISHVQKMAPTAHPSQCEFAPHQILLWKIGSSCPPGSRRRCYPSPGMLTLLGFPFYISPPRRSVMPGKIRATA